MQLTGTFPRTLIVWLFVSALAAVPSFARNADDAVRAAVASGQSARVIMQFATTAERDAAFNRLLDRGAAVRTVDTEGGPALVVFGSAAAFSGEISRATQVSLDAGVRVLASQPARDTSVKRHVPGPGGNSANQSVSRGGMSVAIIDSGIAPHADLPLSRIRAYKDFVTGGTTPVDKCGHGTHVAGIVAGSARVQTALTRASRPTWISWRCGSLATIARATPAT